jgi:hopanoid biosynthesis associated protein HpnK
MKISFILPMFNEIGNIERMIRSTHQVARRTADEFEIIVVDDASTDGSGKLADKLCAEFPELRVLHHKQNRKLGGALKTGFAAARLDYILYMDSDLPVGFDQVERVLREEQGASEITVGYRVGPAENIYREVQSLVYNALLRAVFGLRVRDANFAFKLFRRELVLQSPRSEGSFIDAELLLEAMRRRWPIREVGLHYHVRQAGSSTIGGPRVVPQLLREMLDYRRTRWRGERHVIFNADDFGFSNSVNAGVVAAHEGGLVKSASLMATGDAFEPAADYAREHPALDLGLHFALCDGVPVSNAEKVRSLVADSGRFPENHSAFVRRWLAGRVEKNDVATELRAQMKKARNAGLQITHLDSHQHLHALPGILEVVMQIAAENGVVAVRSPHERGISVFRPFRSGQRIALSSAWMTARERLKKTKLSAPDHFVGVIHAGRWNYATLYRRIRGLRPGVTEICCHPRAENSSGDGHDWRHDSAAELAALTDPELQQFLEDERVQVTTFGEAFAKD